MTANEMRNEAVRLMKSRRRKNSYTNGEDRIYFFGKPDNRPGDTAQAGFSDCSSAVRAAIRAACGADIGWNTDAQLRNRDRGAVVHRSEDGMPDEAALLPGDCLYFRGNAGHLMEVGHVEMYTGPNEITGHGGGGGPVSHAMDAYCARRRGTDKAYFMAVRWITEGMDAAPQARPTLRRGMSGGEVKALQGLLIGQGLSCGRWGADGEFGPATEGAVRMFQRSRGLEPDGIVGPLTWAALERSAREREEPRERCGFATVARGAWTVRTGPAMTCAPMGYVKTGDRLPLSGEEETGWLGVLFAGEQAWISRKAVEA